MLVIGCGKSSGADRKDAAASSEVAALSGGAIGTGGVLGTGGAVGAGGSQVDHPDVALPDTPGSGGAPGSGGKIGTGGRTGSGGVAGIVGAGGAPGSGGAPDAGKAVDAGESVDAGGLSIPFEQAEQYASCVSSDGCHILWVNCGCAAVSTQVAKLESSAVCSHNSCNVSGHEPTDAVCQAGKCTLVVDPPCTADGDCRVLWARCPNSSDPGLNCVCDAAHVSNQTTRNLVSSDGTCHWVMNATSGRAVCDTGHCNLIPGKAGSD
jgi:hypothetical protein